jgi:hypothetical protein
MKQFDQKRLREAWILFFLLGVVMLNYPFIHIFNKKSFIFGIPELIFYLMSGWPLSILIIYLFSKSLGDNANNGDSGDDPGKDQE